MKRRLALTTLATASFAAAAPASAQTGGASPPPTPRPTRPPAAPPAPVSFRGTELPPRAPHDLHIKEFDLAKISGAAPVGTRLDAKGLDGATATIHAELSLDAVRADAAAHRFQHAEMLLTQALALLNDCLSLRSAWSDLRVQDYLLELDSRQFDALDQIHKGETDTAKFYAVDATVSGYMAEAAAKDAQSLSQSATSAAAALKTMFTSPQVDPHFPAFTGDGPVLQQFYAGLVAYLGHVRPQYSGDNKAGNPLTVPVSLTLQDGKTLQVSGSGPDLAGQASIGSAKHSASLQQNSLATQADQFLGQANSAQSRLAGANARSTFDAAMMPFRLARTQVSRDYAKEKSGARTTSGGALNYTQRMRSLEGRFREQMSEALSRLVAVRDGLKKIYNYEPVFRGRAEMAANRLFGADRSPKANANYLDDVVRWASIAQSFLVRFAQNEQSLILPISLQAFLGDNAFRGGLAGNGLGGIWEFPIGEGDFFTDLRHVRLRGVSLYPKVAKLEDPAALWQAIVRVPQDSSYHFSNGATGPVDQRNVPLLRAARLRPRDLLHAGGDIFGAVSAFNVSPFGTWRIVLSEKQGALRFDGTIGTNNVRPVGRFNEGSNRLIDLLLDLHISALYSG